MSSLCQLNLLSSCLAGYKKGPMAAGAVWHVHLVKLVRASLAHSTDDLFLYQGTAVGSFTMPAKNISDIQECMFNCLFLFLFSPSNLLTITCQILIFIFNLLIFILIILSTEKYILIIVLICIFITNDINHFHIFSYLHFFLIRSFDHFQLDYMEVLIGLSPFLED